MSDQGKELEARWGHRTFGACFCIRILLLGLWIGVSVPCEASFEDLGIMNFSDLRIWKPSHLQIVLMYWSGVRRSLNNSQWCF